MNIRLFYRYVLFSLFSVVPLLIYGMENDSGNENGKPTGLSNEGLKQMSLEKTKGLYILLKNHGDHPPIFISGDSSVLKESAFFKKKLELLYRMKNTGIKDKPLKLEAIDCDQFNLLTTSLDKYIQYENKSNAAGFYSDSLVGRDISEITGLFEAVSFLDVERIKSYVASHLLPYLKPPDKLNKWLENGGGRYLPELNMRHKVILPVKIQSSHINSISSIAISPNGEQFVSASSGGEMELWDIEAGKKINLFKNHDSGIKSVVFSKNGKKLISVNDGWIITTWDVNTGKKIRSSKIKFLCNRSTCKHPVALSSNTKNLFIGCQDTVIKLDVNTNEKTDLCRERIFYNRSFHKKKIISLSVGLDEKTLIVGDSCGAITFFNIEGDDKKTSFQDYGCGEYIVKAVVLDLTKRVSISASACNDVITIRDLKSYGFKCVFRPTVGIVESLAFSPKKKELFIGNKSGKIIIQKLIECVDNKKERSIPYLLLWNSVFFNYKKGNILDLDNFSELSELYKTLGACEQKSIYDFLDKLRKNTGSKKKLTLLNLLRNR